MAAQKGVGIDGGSEYYSFNLTVGPNGPSSSSRYLNLEASMSDITIEQVNYTVYESGEEQYFYHVTCPNLLSIRANVIILYYNR